jgi:hypothetical protein
VVGWFPLRWERSPKLDSAGEHKEIGAPAVIRVQHTSRQHDKTAAKTRRHCCVNCGAQAAAEAVTIRAAGGERGDFGVTVASTLRAGMLMWRRC